MYERITFSICCRPSIPTEPTNKLISLFNLGYKMAIYDLHFLCMILSINESHTKNGPSFETIAGQLDSGLHFNAVLNHMYERMTLSICCRPSIPIESTTVGLAME